MAAEGHGSRSPEGRRTEGGGGGSGSGSGSRVDRLAWLPLVLVLALVLVALVRAASLGGEYYDAYEVRAAARSILSGESGRAFPVYRSPLLVAASLGLESLGEAAGWYGPALLSALCYAVLIACSAGLAWRLGARPWVALAAGLLAGLDRVAFAYAPHGMPDVPAAAACGLVLLHAAADRGGPFPARPLLLGALVGVAALCRQNVALVGLALLPGAFASPDRDRPLGRLALTALVAALVYLAVSTAVFALARGSLAAGLAAHRDLLAFHAEQFVENRVKYGLRTPGYAWGLFVPFYVRALLVAGPALLALAVVGAVAAAAAPPWRRGAWVAGAWTGGPGAHRIALAWAGLHLAFVCVAVGHAEARYALPALPALAGLAGLGLETALRRAEARRPDLARAAPWVVPPALLLLAAGLGGSFEVGRALDPVTRRSFAATIAARARARAGPGARYVWTTAHPFPIAPRGLHEPGGAPYPGDPFHGIYHAGPVVLGYHLGAQVAFPVLRDARGNRLAGLTDAAALRDFARSARFEDGTSVRAGDVLLVGLAAPSTTWDLPARPAPSFGVALVVAGPDGLDVELEWLPPPGWE